MFQIGGGIVGVILTHLVYYDSIPKIIEISMIGRSGGDYLGEILGTFILVLCIMSMVHQRSDRTSLIVGFLVAGMLLATSSTMFANPQVTIARIFTYSTAGIRLADAVVFIILQFVASILAVIT